MAESPELSPPAVVNWCHTKSNITKFNFTWTIDNFHFLDHKTGDAIQSSLFSAGSKNESKWFLKIYPRGDLERNKEFVSLFLNLNSLPCNKSAILGKFTLAILNSKGMKVTQKGTTEPCQVHNFILGQDWGYAKFVSREYLLDIANDVLPEEKLTIVCEVQILSDRVNSFGQKSIPQFKIPKCNLVNDLSGLLESKKFSDVTLVVGEREFPAHKTILAARSDVFSAMFEHEMEERKLSRVTITDVDHEVVPEMLHFIYTGEAPNLKKMPAHLFAAADKYALEQLKLLCEEELVTGLSIETAAETLILADLHSAYQLKEKTIDFFKTHAKQVIKTIEWKNLAITNPKLLTEAFEALITHDDNDNLEDCRYEKDEST